MVVCLLFNKSNSTFDYNNTIKKLVSRHPIYYTVIYCFSHSNDNFHSLNPSHSTPRCHASIRYRFNHFHNVCNPSVHASADDEASTTTGHTEERNHRTNGDRSCCGHTSRPTNKTRATGDTDSNPTTACWEFVAEKGVGSYG